MPNAAPSTAISSCLRNHANSINTCFQQVSARLPQGCRVLGVARPVSGPLEVVRAEFVRFAVAAGG